MTSSSDLSAFSALAPYGWDDAWAAEFAPHDSEGLLPGRVIRVDRGQCDVVTADGMVRADTAFVTPHDPMRVICTGDWAVVEPAGNPRYVRAYLPRRTAFVRSTSSDRSEGQILAANIDYAIIAVSLAVELDLGRIERFLALAWESGALRAALERVGVERRRSVNELVVGTWTVTVTADSLGSCPVAGRRILPTGSTAWRRAMDNRLDSIVLLWVESPVVS